MDLSFAVDNATACGCPGFRLPGRREEGDVAPDRLFDGVTEHHFCAFVPVADDAIQCQSHDGVVA